MVSVTALKLPIKVTGITRTTLVEAAEANVKFVPFVLVRRTVIVGRLVAQLLVWVQKNIRMYLGV